MIGVYSIQNIVTGAEYIGSSINVEFRWEQHRSALEQNGHYNPKLQNAWNKYGADAFEFFTIEVLDEAIKSDLNIELDQEAVLRREQMWLDFRRPTYNIVPKVGCPARGKGWHHTGETRQKMSQSRLGPRSLETREKIRQTRLLTPRRIVNRVCEFCDKTFVVYQSHGGRRFCSKDCTYASRRTNA